MSEEQAEALEVEQDQQDDQQEEQQEKKQAQPSAEDVARQKGWKPLEEFEGHPSAWRSAEVFNERGDWVKRARQQDQRINQLEENFKTRLENANKLHQHQMELQKAELVRKRDDAIDDADRVTANKYQDDIDKINAQPIESPQANNSQQTLDNWNAENTWILGADPKAAYGKQQFSNYQNQGLSVEQSIAAMESDVSKAFPSLNPGRETHPLPERGTKPGRRSAAKTLTMGDLTAEERKYRSAMPGAWENDKEFLQAVQDSRSEA